MNAETQAFASVKTVVFHAGSAIEARRLWALSLRREIFRKEKILFFKPVKNSVTNFHRSAASCAQKRETAGPVREFTDYVRETIRIASFSPYVAVVTGPFSLMRPEGFGEFNRLLRSLFPNAAIHFFVSLPRQDILLEMALAQAAVSGQRTAAPDQYMRRRCLDYHQIFRHAAEVFSIENIHFDFPEVTGSGFPATSLQAFWESLGRGGQLEPDTAEPPFLLPQAFWPFCRACVRNESSVFADNPWYTQFSRFTASQGCYILPFRTRAVLYEDFATSNERLAHLLSRESLFAPLVPEAAFEPEADFSLTPDSAYAVALRLDRDFAFARMAEFDIEPAHCLTREQRLVRQALHDVCDPPAAIPLIRSQDEQPKLSVLTLCYNHAPFIAQNIEGVLAQQTNFPIQHIIADDGSNDGSQDIILNYAAKHPRIVPVFRKDRLKTPWNNVQAMFDMARTQYVAICDGDDYFTDPDKLQSQVDFLDSQPGCALCFHPVRVTYEDNPELERVWPEVKFLPGGLRPIYTLKDLIQRNIIQTNSVVYRWRFKNGLPDWFRADLCPGDWYWHLLHAETGALGYIDKIMSVYRRHLGGVYYSVDQDALKHRRLHGMKELELYDVLNRHFRGRFVAAFNALAADVILDCLEYDEERAEKEGQEPLAGKMCEKYPDFARYCLELIKSGKVRQG